MNLVPKVKAFRLRALMTALDHGRPLAVLDEFKDLLVGDGSNGTLTSSAHMAHLLPLVDTYLDHEFKSHKLYSVSAIFDGASDDGERVVLLLRGVVVGESMRIIQRLAALVHMDKAYNAATLNEIISTGMVKNGVVASMVNFFVHDDVSVNKRSAADLKATMYTRAFDISCFSHVFQRVGENTVAPLVFLLFYSLLRVITELPILGREVQKGLDLWLYQRPQSNSASARPRWGYIPFH